MRLALASKVLEAMQTGSSVATLASANTALDLTTPIIESVIGTSLPRAAHVDFFDFQRIFKYDTSPAALSLSNTHLYASVAVVVRYSPDGAPLRLASDGTILDPSYYIVDGLTGRLHILYSAPVVAGPSTLSVAYTSGFLADTVDTQLLVGLPTWIDSAALSAAVYVMNTHPAHMTTRKVGQMEVIIKELSRYLYQQLAPHRRLRANALYPSRGA